MTPATQQRRLSRGHFLREPALIALQTMRAHKLRSFLMLLGIILSVSTLILGWLVVQAVFTIHYAHRYFGDGDADGRMDRGVKFPGHTPTSYTDFGYMAVCIGSTFQVSDFNILTNDYRTLVTLHAVVSFAFNVAVLARGVNMVASVLG